MCLYKITTYFHERSSMRGSFKLRPEKTDVRHVINSFSARHTRGVFACITIRARVVSADGTQVQSAPRDSTRLLGVRANSEITYGEIVLTSRRKTYKDGIQVCLSGAFVSFGYGTDNLFFFAMFSLLPFIVPILDSDRSQIVSLHSKV